MNEYILILGREPELSLAEFSAVAAREGFSFTWRTIMPPYAVVNSPQVLNFFNQLAGIVKVAEVLRYIKLAEAEFMDLAHDALVKSGAEQYHFGFSCYGRKINWLNDVGLELKREFKSDGTRARFVVAREPTLSAVVVSKNKLLPPGFDFVIIPQEQELLVGRTLWVQQFEEWSQRDYGRPARNARVGMLPPKLARMMFNLTGASFNKNIIDPFCGSGTVLQEAALLGYKSLFGADADAKGISRTKENFKWLTSKYPDISEPVLYVSDIEKLSSVVAGRTFGAIVTEPYLGPPLAGNETVDKLKEIQSYLTAFYARVLKILSRLLEPKGKIVMVWPVLRGRGQEFQLPIDVVLAGTNLTISNPLLGESLANFKRERPSLLYERSDQRVAREIFVFERS